MSVRIMSMVFENQKLSSTEKLIMLALADHANDEGKSIYPSQSTVSRKTGLSRGTVNKHIHSLMDSGYLWSRGYKTERSNVLELEIVVNKLAAGIGVSDDDTESDKTGVTQDDIRCHGELHQVSRRMTTGVTQDDTNHQLTINEPSTKLKKEKPDEKPDSDLFRVIADAYSKKKGRLVTPTQRYIEMIRDFEKEGVTVEDYLTAIDEMDANQTYTGDRPTSYANWTIGLARRRQKPKEEKKAPHKPPKRTYIGPDGERIAI